MALGSNTDYRPQKDLKKQLGPHISTGPTVETLTMDINMTSQQSHRHPRGLWALTQPGVAAQTTDTRISPAIAQITGIEMVSGAPWTLEVS